MSKTCFFLLFSYIGNVITRVFLSGNRSKMSTYKLYYFNARGRAETSRLIFAQTGVAYEDTRLEGEKWQELKPSTPTGMMPILEVDGKQLVGSGVISRFLGERLEVKQHTYTHR